jgi:dipeptidyl aminopeptidase/acylaminoacyl peptidase
VGDVITGARAFGAALFSVSFVFGSCAAVLAAPPVEAFGSLPTVTSARLSPDGKHLAVIGPVGGHNAVTVFALDTPTATPMRAAFPDAEAVGIKWANNVRLIVVFKMNIKRPGVDRIDVWERAISVAIDGGKAVVLMHDAPFYTDYYGTTDTAAIVDQDPADPDTVYMVAYESDAEREAKKYDKSAFESDRNVQTEKWTNDVYTLNYFKVNVTTGESEIVNLGTPETIEYITDGKGHILGRIDRTDDLKDHYYVGNREVATFDARGGDVLRIRGLSPDGTTLAATSYANGNTYGLFTYQFGAPSVGAPLFVDPDHDIEGIADDEWSGRVAGVAWAVDKFEYKYFDLAVEHVKERVEQALPGQSVAVVSKDNAENNFVMVAAGAQNPSTYYLFDAKAGQLSIVAPTYPGLTSADLGPQRTYVYKSKDGTQISAYLTLPPGKAAKDLPTVILPHGGPAERDALGFDWWPQFLASRGYAVLQPNFRGSNGYGVKFRDAGDGEWAGKVLEDINGGAEQLVKDGIADPKRMCIVGASYGGYVALAAATFTPDVYACAVSYAGLSDLKRTLDRTVRDYGEHSQDLSIWEKRMGATVFETDKLAAISPAIHAAQVKAPVLLIHSDKDVTVYLEQSTEEQDALQSAGKSVELIKLEGDDHYLHQSTTRIQMLKAIETFLAAHIGT